MLRVSRRTFRIVCGLALASLCVIILTGALVRLTGSGLGCADWPRCNESKFVDVSGTHTRIEQMNRLFTGVVSFSVIAAVLLAYRRVPRRPDLIRLAWGLVLGVLAQVVIGGIVVLTGLNPFANMAHFLVSMLLVLCGFALYRRSSAELGDPWFRAVPERLVGHLRLFACCVPLAVVSGTVVTATGPHAGDENAVRFDFALESVARIHSISVIVTVAILVALMVRTRRWHRVDPDTGDALTNVAVVACLQAGVGYLQYFTGVPVALVAAHIVGATWLWLATCALVLAPSRPFDGVAGEIASVRP